MAKIDIVPGLICINESSKKRRVLAVVGTKIFYQDYSGRRRGEPTEDIIRSINRRLDRTSDWVPPGWGISGESEVRSIFSCSERAFHKWLGKGTVASKTATADVREVRSSHQVAQEMLKLPDLPLVHPGIAGDVFVEVLYHDIEDKVIVVSDRVEASPGSESGRHEGAVKLERERCLRLIEARCKRLHEVIQNYPPDHRTHSKIAAALENLRVVERWISAGRQPKHTTQLNPGGST